MTGTWRGGIATSFTTTTGRLGSTRTASLTWSPISPWVQKQRDEYLLLRREFEPTTVALVIVAGVAASLRRVFLQTGRQSR